MEAENIIPTRWLDYIRSHGVGFKLLPEEMEHLGPSVITGLQFIQNAHRIPAPAKDEITVKLPGYNRWVNFRCSHRPELVFSMPMETYASLLGVTYSGTQRLLCFKIYIHFQDWDTVNFRYLGKYYQRHNGTHYVEYNKTYTYVHDFPLT